MFDLHTGIGSNIEWRDFICALLFRESVARVIHQQSSVAQFVATTFRAELLRDADRHFGVYYRGKASKVNADQDVLLMIPHR